MNMALDVVRKFLNENLRELTVPVYTAHDVHTGNQQDFHTANESRVGSIGSTINNGSNHSTINVNFNFYIGESSVESIPLKTTPPATVATAPVMTNLVLLANAPFVPA